MTEFWQWFIGAGVAANILLSAFWLGGLNRQVNDMQKAIDKLPCLNPKNECKVSRR